MNPCMVFLDRGSLPMPICPPELPLQWREYESTQPEQVLARLEYAEVAISNKVPLLADTLAQLPGLKLIAIAATGANNVDLEYCRKHGIAVCNVSGYSTHSVAEHTFALLLALRRQLVTYHADIVAGEWQKAAHFALFSHPVNDLQGSTLGIFGYGEIGQAVARIAAAFEMKVLVAERKNSLTQRKDRVSFEQMLTQADVVSLHCPLTAETRHLIGVAELRLMKRSALLINVARGGVVDEAALIQALQEGWIAGAGIDVLSTEPPKNGNPLLECIGPNCLVTPHIAWASQQAMARLAKEILCNITAFYRGESRNRLV